METISDQTRKYDHIAYFTKKYLDLIIEGKKTIESRFSKTRRAPFHKVRKDHIIALKQVGGDIIGHFVTDGVLYITGPNIEKIKRTMNSKILEEDDYWNLKENSNYATLIEIGEITIYENPFPFKSKKAQSAWIVIEEKKDLSKIDHYFKGETDEK